MSNFTKEQQQAIESTGNVLCIAGAGSGKTKVFVERIKYLINNGIAPRHILGITFTNKSTTEMQERLSNLIGEFSTKQVKLSTIHSCFYRELMNSNMFNIKSLKPTPEWQKMKWGNDLAGKQTYYNHHGLNLGINGGDFLMFISNQKSRGLTCKDQIIIDDKVSYAKVCYGPDLQKAWIEYERLKTEANYIDFDDMLMLMKKALLESEDFLNICKDKFKYIMVDEVQDSSPLALECLALINNEQVFGVGDLRQSIYSFQGADVENILNSSRLFPNQQLIQLYHNFRSTENIVELSNNIISQSSIEEYEKFVDAKSISDTGCPVEFNIYHNEYAQIEDVAKQIQQSYEDGVPYHENFILVRTNNSTMPIEEILTEMDIPHDVSSNGSYYEKKEVLDLLSYARLAINTNDDTSFRRVYNTPTRYLSNKLMEQIQTHTNDYEISLFEAVAGDNKIDCGKGQQGIDKLVNVINRLRSMVNTLKGDRFLESVIEMTNYKDYLHKSAKSSQQAKERITSVDRLIKSAGKFANIKAFLAFITQVQIKQQESKKESAVQILTIHSSKGLEADNVYVVNLVEDMLPHKSAIQCDGLEEERRLFYVACSRARKNLYVSSYIQDEDGENVEVSEFVSELLGDFVVKEMTRNIYREGGKKQTYEWSAE